MDDVGSGIWFEYDATSGSWIENKRVTISKGSCDSQSPEDISLIIALGICVVVIVVIGICWNKTRRELEEQRQLLMRNTDRSGYGSTSDTVSPPPSHIL